MSTDKPRKTLADLAAEASTASGIRGCPVCGCRDLRKRFDENGRAKRYCRNCGHEVRGG